MRTLGNETTNQITDACLIPWPVDRPVYSLHPPVCSVLLRGQRINIVVTTEATRPKSTKFSSSRSAARSCRAISRVYWTQNICEIGLRHSKWKGGWKGHGGARCLTRHRFPSLPVPRVPVHQRICNGQRSSEISCDKYRRGVTVRRFGNCLCFHLHGWCRLYFHPHLAFGHSSQQPWWWRHVPKRWLAIPYWHFW
jgi:hypothetical protein